MGAPRGLRRWGPGVVAAGLRLQAPGPMREASSRVGRFANTARGMGNDERRTTNDERSAFVQDSHRDLELRLAALEARLEDAEAHASILDLKSRYGTLADARYTRSGPRSQPEIDGLADQLAELFAEDAVWEGGGNLGRCEGKNAIRERFRAPTLHYSWHFFVKPDITVTGDLARGTWDVLAMITTTEGRALWMVGVERDEYARVDGRWLHTRMQLDSELMAPYDRGWAPNRSPA